jgi:hypothetical protein
MLLPLLPSLLPLSSASGLASRAAMGISCP